MEDAKGNEHWLELYKDAVSEHDPDVLAVRISEAQKAIQQRERQLWYEGSLERSERERLDAASRYLEMLRVFGAKGGSHEAA